MGLVDVTVRRGVATLRFNNPRKLNAWGKALMAEKHAALAAAEADDSVKAVVLTGTGKYYCAGVDLPSVLKPMPPAKLVKTITEMNEKLFDVFLTFQKPIFAAVNGPSIGAAVTSATLCDGIVANTRATFHTPFAALGLVPEGCSSVLFDEILGKDMANKMLNENYKMSAAEALEHHMLLQVVESGDEAPEEGEDTKLVEAAMEHAERYLEAHGGKRARPAVETERLRKVNADESVALANAFVSERFFRAMEANAARSGKTNVVRTFQGLRLSRPIWSLFL